MSELRLSQTEAARFLGIHKMHLSSWKSRGILVPRPPAKGGKALRYGLRDLVAGLFALSAVEDLRFEGEALKEMVAAVQRGDDDELAHAVIVTLKTRPGFMKHAWIPDVRLPLDNEAEYFGLDDYELTTGNALIAELKSRGKYNTHATLKEAVEALLGQVKKKLEQDAMLATGNEAA